MRFPSLFSSEIRRTEPSITPNQQRGKSTDALDSECNEQLGCAFFMRLPAEIRNEVYTFVYSDKVQQPQTKVALDKEEQDAEKHGRPRNGPLSFLLTCRRIKVEATIVAFQLHSFTISENLPFYTLRARTKLLTANQISAITSLTYAVGGKNGDTPLYDDQVANFITHAALLFPNAHDIRVTFHRKGQFSPEVVFPYGRPKSCVQHVPDWITRALNRFVTCQVGYQWQNGEHWSANWPNLHVHESARKNNMPVLRGQLCDGNCTAVLTQQSTGREINVSLMTIWAGDTPLVFLNPETLQRLPVEVVDTDTGLGGVMYDPGDEYWNKLRAWELSPSNDGVFGTSIHLSDAVSMLWGASLPKFLWDEYVKRKEVTVLKVPEHLKEGGTGVGDPNMVGFGFDPRDLDSTAPDK